MLDREIGKKPAVVGWTLGVDGGRENGKESTFVEEARSEENRETKVEMGMLCEDGYQEGGDGWGVERVG